MKISENKKDIIQYINDTKGNKNLELEARITAFISQGTFNDVLKRLKGLPTISKIESEESLDISTYYKSGERDEQSNIRTTIHGIEAIKKYCRSNDIKEIGNISFTKKTRVSNTYVKDYNLRFNLKNEEELPKTHDFIKPMYVEWKGYPKTFRYKKRFSFTTKDNLFRFDLTIIKSSNQKTFKSKRTKLKSEVKPYEINKLLKPDEELDTKKWFKKLRNNQKVTIETNSYRDIKTRTLQESNTLKNPLRYEIEIEYIGNKSDHEETSEDIFNLMIKNIGVVLQSIQKTYYIISESEKNMVLEEYDTLMDSKVFKGPHNVTLELKHIVPKKYEDYNNVLTVRRNYSITDKADGERNLLIVLKNGDLYLMNRKNVIKSLNAKIPALKQSIFDCEYLVKDKNNNNINLLMVFDVYFINNMDVRLSKFNKEKESDTDTRYEIMKLYLSNLNIEKDETNNLDIKLKKFYYTDIETYNAQVDENITELEESLTLLEEGGKKYNEILLQIKDLKKDTKIFSEADKIYNKEYIYNIDGLIFTPAFLGVGQSYGSKTSSFDGRWYSSFKWKPPEENSIDFMVRIKKDENNKDLVEYASVNGKFISYKTLILCTGYDPKKHTEHNSCRVLNENPLFEQSYTYVPFIPTNPYRKESQYAFIKLDVNGVMKTEDNNIITNNCILECRYDTTKEDGFKWIPMRVRDTNKPNDFITAKNVWNTIFYPVTLDMLTTGKIDNIENIDEVYYSKNIKRKNLETKPMNDFHSYVKKMLITNYTKPGDSLLDISCGRAGDLNHWIDAKLDKIVGIDYNRENLEHPDNGACIRLIKKDEDFLNNNTLIIWGDSSKDYLDGSAGKDELNKYYLDIVYGNVKISEINNEKLMNLYNIGNLDAGNGFNVISCQFSLHYFFENKDKLDGVLNNISNSLKSGGIFIGTTLDGKKVFDLLKKNTSLGKHKNGQLLWKISKKYNSNKFSNNDSCLGYKVDVYMESIGKTNTEYLVNYNYLESILENYNLRLKEYLDFSDVFDRLSSYNTKYGDALGMIDELKTYSFLNKCFVIEKI